MEKEESVLSPGFRMAAARAGWDEESLLLATLVVEDTPVRESRQKKRTNLIKSPPTSNSNRKRRSRKGADLLPAVVLSLDDEADDNKDPKKEVKKGEEKVVPKEENNAKEIKSSEESSSSKELPCMDKLREELCCGICLEICFEPSSTPCGHSFCIKCLKQAASKCGKRCPECRQLISNARACTINTILWNTIQLLFPKEIEARKKSQNNQPSKEIIPQTNSIKITNNPLRNISNRVHNSSSSFVTASQLVDIANSRRRPSQSEDAMLAQRLQREEFLLARNEGPSRNTTVNAASANLRAIALRASRAVYSRNRNHRN
ncbi:hypothetical protein LUZ60_007784 [Juncus effusus]|nr:hypothetical protein LUZ60_007784 [Juncus effusus]